MSHDNDRNFLEWLKNRLVNKYREDKLIVDTLDSIIKTKTIISQQDKIINRDIVEKICNKMWPNFDGTNSGDVIAIEDYSEDEKEKIRKYVTGILLEYKKG